MFAVDDVDALGRRLAQLVAAAEALEDTTHEEETMPVDPGLYYELGADRFDSEEVRVFGQAEPVAIIRTSTSPEGALLQELIEGERLITEAIRKACAMADEAIADIRLQRDNIDKAFCRHGRMVFRKGVNHATNREWRGWFCPAGVPTHRHPGTCRPNFIA